MNLTTYLEEQDGRASSLADAIGVSKAFISQFKLGNRPVPDWLAVAIEKATNGVVTCEEVSPGVQWCRLADASWPYHAAGKPLVSPARRMREAA